MRDGTDWGTIEFCVFFKHDRLLAVVFDPLEDLVLTDSLHRPSDFWVTITHTLEELLHPLVPLFGKEPPPGFILHIRPVI